MNKGEYFFSRKLNKGNFFRENWIKIIFFRKTWIKVTRRIWLRIRKMSLVLNFKVKHRLSCQIMNQFNNATFATARLSWHSWQTLSPLHSNFKFTLGEIPQFIWDWADENRSNLLNILHLSQYDNLLISTNLFCKKKIKLKENKI